MDQTAHALRVRPSLRRVDRLARERASVNAGIDLVASGGARRVVLCGLKFAERLLADAVPRALSVGARVSLDRTDEPVPAIIVTTI